MLLQLTCAAAGIQIVEYDLPNGLHVILHEDHSVPLVAVSVMYHTGSKNEDATHSGYAGFIEHLLYNGGDTHSGEYNEIIQAAGGQSGSNTTQDRTVFYELLPSAQMGLGIWAESRHMAYEHIDKANVDEQHKITKQEKYKYYSTPYALRYNIIYENAYTTSPYRWNTIAKDQAADKATEADVATFYKNYYVPNNAVIVIAGDINQKYARDYIDRYFGDIPAGTQPINHTFAAEPAHTTEKRIAYYDNVQAPAVIVAYHIPEYGNTDYYGVQLLVHLLATGNNARFNRNITSLQKAQTVSAIAPANEQPGLAIILGIAAQGVKPDELERSIIAETDNLGQVTEEEYQRIQDKAESGYVLDNQKLQVLAQGLATGYTYRHNARMINDDLANYRKITRADLARIAAKYFTKQNRLVIYYLPKSMQQKK
jgi:zinc protease